MKTFLAEWMNFNQINPVELSEKTGIAQSFISKWLVGESTPTLAGMAAIAKVFDITIDDLVYSTPYKPISRLKNKHSIETNEFKNALRLRNYFISKKLEVEIIVAKTAERDLYTVNYISDDPLDIDEIAKIIRKKKYSDPLEKVESSSKYTGMKVIIED